VTFVAVRSGVSYASPTWADRIAFRHTSNWTSAVYADDTDWIAWEALHKFSDFPLLPIYRIARNPDAEVALRVGEYSSHVFANVVSNKSIFALLPAFAYGNLDIWYEYQRRWWIRMEILRRLNAGHPIDDSPIGVVTIAKEGIEISIDDSIVGFLAKRNARLLIPSDAERLFPNAIPRQSVEHHILLSFGG
jgi:hypothetical protein